MTKIELINKGTINRNMVIIENKGKCVYLYFSYKTLIGVNNKILNFSHSRTTGKFRNQIINENNISDRNDFIDESQLNDYLQKELKSIF